MLHETAHASPHPTLAQNHRHKQNLVLHHLVRQTTQLGPSEAEEEKAVKKWEGIMASAGIALNDDIVTLAKTYLASRESIGKKTQMNSRRDVLGFAMHIQRLPVRPFEVQDWLDSHSAWGDTTKGKAKSHLSSFFKWLIFREYITSNPCLGVKSYKSAARGEEYLLTEEQYSALYARCKGTFALMVRLMWLTGCRPGELRSLKVSEIDFIGQSITKGEHKMAHKGQSRTILLNDEAMALLEMHLGGKTAGYVFLSGSGRPYTEQAFGDNWRRARRKAGLPDTVIPYSERHTFAASKLAQGHAANGVAALLGHKGTRTLYQNYGHILDDMEKWRHIL